MLTLAEDKLDVFGNAFAGFEYFPYILLAGLPLCLLYLVLRSRPHSVPQPAPSVESAASEQPAAATASRIRYVDVASRSVLAPRVVEAREDIFDQFPTADSSAGGDERIADEIYRDQPADPAASKVASELRSRQLDADEDRSVGWGVVIGGLALVAILLFAGWRFPGVDAVRGFTPAGWWAIGILVALTLPSIIRKSLSVEGIYERFTQVLTWLLVSTAAMALVVAALGLGMSAPWFRAWFEQPGPPQPTKVTTETLVPSSVTFDSGSYFGIFLGGTSAEVSGLVETENGVRTFSTTKYRYGDEWQLITEETCTTTTYTSPLVIQDGVDQEQCFTSTIAILGDELPTN